MASQSIKKLAARALEDGEFAQKVLSGEEDYPQIRDAILADLFESTQGESQPRGATKATKKVKFEARFIDAGPRFGPMGPCYVKYYPKMPAADAWDKWIGMPRSNLQRIAGR